MAVHRLGLTGGIGSGKSTVASILGQLGATVVDADAISRAATAPGGPAIASLKDAFGVDILTADGALDRLKMRALVYADTTAKARLEGIIHPIVGREIIQQALQAEAAGAPCVVLDIPLLVESGHWRKTLDRILVIDCSEETQIERVMARSGLTAADVRKIIAAQTTRAKRLNAADVVLLNDGLSIDDLAQTVREIGVQFGL